MDIELLAGEIWTEEAELEFEDGREEGEEDE